MLYKGTDDTDLLQDQGFIYLYNQRIGDSDLIP